MKRLRDTADLGFDACIRMEIERRLTDSGLATKILWSLSEDDRKEAHVR
jgi:hypothetical protein